MQKETAKQKIQKLVEKYEQVVKSGQLKKYSEEQTKKDFIMPLFEVLGWDVFSKSEVSAEESIKSAGRVDYGFYLNGRPKFYLEAKALKADLHKPEYAEQAIKYSWNKGVTWAVLTDFESIKIFNAEAISKYLFDKMFFEIPCTEYLERFDQLWILSKESFEQDLINKEATKLGKMMQRVPVGERLYKDLNECRDILIKELSSCNPNINKDLLDEGIQKLLDRLIFLRVAEDRGIETDTLKSLMRQWKGGGIVYESTVLKFRELDEIYNSNLFTEHPFEKWEDYAGVTGKVIKKLYGKEGYYEYDFKVMAPDVLGGVYESYLGHRLSQSKKGLTLDKDAKKRKEHGIYYTPDFIVDYITRNALRPVLDKCKSVNDLKKIRVLDPACGSGSFLIKALNVIYDKYKEFNNTADESTVKLTILMENIYGVDLDEQAVEIAQLNLLINALYKKQKFPRLDHIKNGNSLISGTDEELKKYFGKNWHDKKRFNWEEEFPEVFRQGGFDVIIGNPPYVRVHKLLLDDKKYYWNNYLVFKAKSDLYACFMQKSIDLLKDQGIFSYIVSNTWLTLESFTELRKYILDNCIVSSFLFPSKKVFQDATVETVIFTFKKEKNQASKLNNEIEIYDIDNNLPKLKEKINQNNYNNNFNYSFYVNQSNRDTSNVKQDKILPLRECIKFVYGFKTGDDEKFLTKDKNISPLAKKILRRSDFSRYSISFQGEYIIYDQGAMKKHKKTARPGDRERFEQDKILVQDIGKKIVATLDKDKYYIKDALILLKKENLSLMYLLALLNSKFINSWYKNKFKVLSVAKNAILEIPIYKIDFSNPKEKAKHDELAKLAKKMLELNKELQKTPENSNKWNFIKSEIERMDKKINEEVCKLYGLTEKEIKIIEE